MAIMVLNSKGQVTLPQAVRKSLGIREGDVLAVSVDGTRIVLTPKVLVDRHQAWFWTADWQTGEKEASEDIKRGRVFDFETAKAAIASLDK